MPYRDYMIFQDNRILFCDCPIRKNPVHPVWREADESAYLISWHLYPRFQAYVYNDEVRIQSVGRIILESPVDRFELELSQ